MGKGRLFIVIVVILAISIFLWIQFSAIPNNKEVNEDNVQESPETHNFEKVLEYENEYMGNASNMSALFQALPLNDEKGTLEMDSEQFLLIVNYSSPENEADLVKQSVIYNTT